MGLRFKHSSLNSYENKSEVKLLNLKYDCILNHCLIPEKKLVLKNYFLLP
ncbi:hypothetical protein SAMN04488062_10183 [Flavobacterium omnivorum]|uniref:Uncharacterized protein n=1 Tax=Flavobacterium omnivorum TaxID=178355 RepID=A0A1G7VNF4_9FLAO|nr:hypothetical protein SAMN04488062_10183 [Flavobacterium omnivorum]